MRSIYRSEEGERAVRERYQEFLQHWPVPNQHLRLATREGETFVVASGVQNAPALVLLHGASGDAAMWMGDIAQWTNHFRVYAVDVIGDAGWSAPSRPPLDSDAHALWLDDVMRGLRLERASFAGVSNGAWLALDYAIRRPGCVDSLVLLAPGGIVPSKNILPKALLLLLLGNWGARKLREMILGRTPENASPAHKAFADFLALIFRNLRPRTKRHPIFTDEALQALRMPLLVILGGNDPVLPSAKIKERLQRHVPHAEIRYLAEAGHHIPGQAAAVLDFLCRAHVTLGP
ncbi:MAG: alpha/beta hydrolase [Acidobacteriia bacterium]|nr:alpha/beta hydrolase [Terriglobia bacterium]